ncbi:MAG: lysophospholipid acyltransferase family protein [Clostridia bacterium]
MWLFYVLRPFWWLISLVVFPVKIFNKKKLPKTRCIVAMNHLSGWDPVIVVTHTDKLVHFMTKSTLYKSKFLKWVFNLFQFVPVNRDGTDYSAIKQVISILEKDKPFGIFPEGTRNYKDPDHIQEFKNGLALFAIKTQSPIYPVLLKRKTKAFRKNYITFGEPIFLDEFYGQRVTSELTDEATQVIWEKMNVVQGEFNAMLAEKYPKKFGKKD